MSVTFSLTIGVGAPGVLCLVEEVGTTHGALFATDTYSRMTGVFIGLQRVYLNEGGSPDSFSNTTFASS